MPAGEYKSDHPLTTPPRKTDYAGYRNPDSSLFGCELGPVIPVGEAFVGIEATKGNNGYYLISDGSTMSYRTRIRTPSFPHMQFVPEISQGYTISDLMAILGSTDYVLSDVDR